MHTYFLFAKRSPVASLRATRKMIDVAAARSPQFRDGRRVQAVLREQRHTQQVQETLRDRQRYRRKRSRPKRERQQAERGMRRLPPKATAAKAAEAVRQHAAAEQRAAGSTQAARVCTASVHMMCLRCAVSIRLTIKVCDL